MIIFKKTNIRNGMKMNNGEIINKIEDLLEKDCFVIDFLPRRVPENSGGRFFAVEDHYLENHGAQLRRKFADILLKLNCYYGFTVCSGEDCVCEEKPSPARVEALTLENKTFFNILIESENTLLSVDRDSIYISVYNPSSEVLRTLESLAQANGLFIRKSGID